MTPSQATKNNNSPHRKPLNTNNHGGGGGSNTRVLQVGLRQSQLDTTTNRSN